MSKNPNGRLGRRHAFAEGKALQKAQREATAKAALTGQVPNEAFPPEVRQRLDELHRDDAYIVQSMASLFVAHIAAKHGQVYGAEPFLVVCRQFFDQITGQMAEQIAEEAAAQARRAAEPET